METTCIRRADWAVIWNSTAGRHEYMRAADIAFSGDRIIHVGRRFAGTVDHEIDGTGLLAMPGLIDIHGHPTSQTLQRGIMEEAGNSRLYNTPLYDYYPLWQTDDEGLRACAEVAYAELLASGVTTAVDYARPCPSGWIDLMARSGLRVYAAPSFRDAAWSVRNGHAVDYVWDEEQGRRAFAAAVAIVDRAMAHPCGRLGGVIAPAHADTCTDATLTTSWEIASERGLMWQIHAAQTVVEFHETVRRHGKTPVQRLADLGVLSENSTLAHCVFIDTHSRTRWPTARDLALLAESGATVAHCPVAFARIGFCLETLGGYIRSGVNLGLGTDTQPQNMIEEMRTALMAARIASGRIDDICVADVFYAATVGGANALLRRDIGRLSPGAKADIVLVDLTCPHMRPLRDPIRSLVFSAADRAVRDVFVDGHQVVSGGFVGTLDQEKALIRLQAAQDEAERKVRERDPAGRCALQAAPPVFPIADG